MPWLRITMRDDLPLMPSLGDLLASQESRNRTLLPVVPDEAMVDRAISATEHMVGDLTQHHTGLLFAVPGSRVLGLEKGTQ